MQQLHATLCGHGLLCLQNHTKTGRRDEGQFLCINGNCTGPVPKNCKSCQKHFRVIVYDARGYGRSSKQREDLLFAHPDTCVRIPMRNHLRSLNLSNSVAIAVYEVLRQYDFEGLQVEGQLTTHVWGEGQL